MAQSKAATSTRHPVQAKYRISPAVLLFALIGAPLAWGFQTVAGMEIARHACFPKDVPLASPAFAYAHTLLATIIAAAFVIGLGALAASILAWRRTRGETRGDGHTLVEIGEGRTRFLAMCAVIVSIGFTGAIVFASVGLIVVPLC